MVYRRIYNNYTPGQGQETADVIVRGENQTTFALQLLWANSTRLTETCLKHKLQPKMSYLNCFNGIIILSSN